LLTRQSARTPFPTVELVLRGVFAQQTGSGRPRLVAGGVGLLVGAVVAVALDSSGNGRRPVERVMLTLLAATAGAFVPDWRTRKASAARQQRLLAELPTIAELLALAVAAGDGAAAALDRVTRVSHGELAGELRGVLAAAQAGEPLTVALDRVALRTPVAALARFVDGLVVALERGTPLADLLHAQAADAREASRRALLEAGARKELAMLFPVVFLVLPISVIFALFPALEGFSFITP
jgi:tight adherence protein C